MLQCLLRIKNAAAGAVQFIHLAQYTYSVATAPASVVMLVVYTTVITSAVSIAGMVQFLD